MSHSYTDRLEDYCGKPGHATSYRRPDGLIQVVGTAHDGHQFSFVVDPADVDRSREDIDAGRFISLDQLKADIRDRLPEPAAQEEPK